MQEQTLHELNSLQVNQDARAALEALGERPNPEVLHLVQLIQWGLESDVPLQNEDQREDLRIAAHRLDQYDPSLVLRWIAGENPENVPLASSEPREAAREALDLYWMAMTPDSE